MYSKTNIVHVQYISFVKERISVSPLFLIR